jgi:hypothetical protein
MLNLSLRLMSNRILSRGYVFIYVIQVPAFQTQVLYPLLVFFIHVSSSYIFPPFLLSCDFYAFYSFVPNKTSGQWKGNFSSQEDNVPALWERNRLDSRLDFGKEFQI